MKKMIVLATVAIMAVCSQAASFKWSANGVTDGTNPISGTATLSALIDGSWTVVDTKTMTAGVIASSQFANDAFVGGTTYQFKYEVVTANGVFTSSTKSTRAQANSTPTISFGSAGTWAGGGQGGETVPEPTSGLLLLVGGALLGLRRKRA